LLNQHGQVLGEAEAAATLAVAGMSEALLAAALALRQASAVAAFAEHQLSRVAAFAEHRLSGAHTLTAELLADQVPHLDFTMAALECLVSDRAGSLPWATDQYLPPVAGYRRLDKIGRAN